MRCPVRSGENVAILLDYCARTLDSERAALLELHMTSCAECQAFRDGQTAVWSSLDAWEPPAVAAEFNPRLLARIDEEERKPWWRKWRGAWTAVWLEPAVPIAVAGLALLAGFLFQATSFTPVTAPPEDGLAGSVPARIGPAEIDQAETALQDIEMLRALADVVAPAESPQHPI